MRYMIVSWIVSTVAFMLASYLLPGFHVANLTTALAGAAVLGVCNALIRPVIILFTLPVTVLTLGLFLVVINGLMLYLTAAVVHGVDITNFVSAVLAALFISVVNAILGSVLGWSIEEVAMFLHTRLKVRDMDRAIAFYTSQLGFKLGDRKVSPRGSYLAFLHMDGTPTELELAYLPWDTDFKLDEDIFHLAFEVTGMAGVIERMRAAGVKVTEEPEQTGSGSWMAFIEDPDGYEIELLDYSQVKREARPQGGV